MSEGSRRPDGRKPEPNADGDPPGAGVDEAGAAEARGPSADPAAGDLLAEAADPPARALAGPPAHWLADIRARAPHLLGPDGRLVGGSTPVEVAGPAGWPHGPDTLPPTRYAVDDRPVMPPPAYPEPAGGAPPAEPRFGDPAQPAEPAAPAYGSAPTGPAGGPGDFPTPATPPASPAPGWPADDRPPAPPGGASPQPPSDGPPPAATLAPPPPTSPASPASPAPQPPGRPSPDRPPPTWDAWPRFTVAARSLPAPERAAWGTPEGAAEHDPTYPDVRPAPTPDPAAWGTAIGRRRPVEPRYEPDPSLWASLLEPPADEPPDWRPLERRLERRARLDREQRGR